MRYRAVTTEEELAEVVKAYSKFDAFCFDVETRGTRMPRWKGGQPKDRPALDSVTNEVFWVGLAGPGRSDAIPCGHKTGPKQLFKAQVFDALEPLFFSERQKINHNIKFDLLSIAKYYGGDIPPGPYGETMVLAKLLNENLPEYKLGALVERYLKYKYLKLGENVDGASFDEATLYVHNDPKTTWLMHEHLLPRLEKVGLLPLYEMEMELLGVLARMYQQGIYVDIDGFDALDVELTERLAEQEERIYEIGGMRFLLTSQQQKAKFLYDHLKIKCPGTTEKGNRKTDEKTLHSIRNKHPAVQALLEYSAVQKLDSTFVKGYRKWVTDNRLRTQLNQYGARTGRFSSDSPNLQNVPARDRVDAPLVRSLFIAPKGKLLVVGDYGQVELRVIAHFCKDPNLRKAFIRGLDLHAYTASLVFGVPMSEVTKEQRAIGKTLNFAIVYGGGPQKIMDVAGVSMRRAKKILNSLFDAYANISPWKDEVVRFCRNHKYTTTILGRKRRLPEIDHPEYKWRGYAERQAVNHVVQGTAAEIMKMAMVRLQRRIDREGLNDQIKLVLQIHDEIILEVDQGYEEQATEMMREAMEQVHWADGKPILSVPLVADIHTGRTWADAK